MTDNWDFYFCRVNDALSSIFVNLGLRTTAPDPRRPHLLWVWLPMRAPRPDGLSSNEEADQLGAIEDALVAALGASLDAVWAGRITGADRRELYFYAPHADGFATQVARVFLQFPDYEPETGDQPDPAWAQYLELLYPRPRQREQMKNRHVIDALTEAGDELTTPRPITHWVYFADVADRATAASLLAAAGFTVELEDATTDSATRPYPLRAERVDRADQDAVDTAVFGILDAIAEMDAEYDGWESPVEGAP